VANLSGAAWTIVEINGKPMDAADKDHRKIVLAFDATRGTFSGTSGCNDLAGRFAKNGAPLTPASDQPPQLCRVDEQTERGMRSAIQNARGYRVSSTTLELLDAKGECLAKLER
jgi:heat shock protein HslJ